MELKDIYDIVIPARYGSTRLPGKPLLRATGKYLVQHVYERAMQSRRARRLLPKYRRRSGRRRSSVDGAMALTTMRPTGRGRRQRRGASAASRW